MQKLLVTRRKALAAGLLVPYATGANGQVQAEEFSEVQIGDPEQAAQTLVLDKATLDKIEGLLSIAAFNVAKDVKQVALRSLAVAQEYVGMNQRQNPEMVEELFRVLGMEPRDGGKQLLPFCAAGVSYCIARAYCEYEVPEVIAYTTFNRERILKEAMADVNTFFIRPSAGVRIVESDAKRRGKWIERKGNDRLREQVGPGHLVVFDWTNDGLSDHIGLVKSISGQTVQTLEFNTRPDGASAGGHVLQKDRDLSLVRGFVGLYNMKQ